MRSLSFITIFLLSAGFLFSQSPHGDKLNLDCSFCHQSDSWKIDKDKMEFNHTQTDFDLAGQHNVIDCRSCHTSLIFENAKPECLSCHKDVHQNSVGLDCQNCHSPETWIVKNINLIHQQSRFPLLGAHQTADCAQCHSQFAALNFQPIGVRCFDCHASNYNSAASPNHILANFSTDCEECHSLITVQWGADNFAHDFFPLIGGHKISDCFKCHQQGSNFKGLDGDCYSCHRSDYETVTNPNHVTGNFSTDCSTCHDINAWSPAYFDHNQSQFPLTGAHINVNCQNCHSAGFSGTPSDCYSCHKQNYDSVTDPNHIANNFSTNCTDCHSTNSWGEVTFNHNLTTFPLTGKHSTADCNQCHSAGYANTSTECYSCHKTDYDNSANPNHSAASFPTTCADCHSTNNWKPAQFDHDGQYFPIYSGEHAGEWNACSDCHTNSSNYSVFSCINCHEHNKTDMDNDHSGIAGYVYASNECFACHPTGSKQGAFNHGTSSFPLTGAHISVDCIQCHSTGYANTSIDCYNCHSANYNSTANPSHTALVLPTDCKSCHTTNPGWQPALFPQHNDFYILQGAHSAIASQCANCHSGNYTLTPNTCFGCHQNNYNNTTNPPHGSSGFGTDCETCHSQNAWTPANFNHDGQYFPIYSGEHAGEWNTCNDCHTNSSNYSVFSCIDCHEHNKTDMDNDHSGITGYVYASNECFACHPTGSKQGAFNHGTSSFPLTGAHISVDCIQCHSTGYANTSIDCYNCHSANYNSTANPSHTALVLPTDCKSCHTTNPGWQPALFPQHNDFYILQGAHSAIASQCANCHSGNYTLTPNTCFGCHQNNYNNTTNPPHGSSGFGTDCETCHSQNAWTPANFNHDGQYFPIYSGEHAGEWNTCNDCHTNSSNYSVFSCIDCHEHNKTDMDNDHNGVAGYVYLSSACYACHPTGSKEGAFNHINSNFPLTGAHVGVDCGQCHTNGYLNTSSACVSCHQSNYNNTSNPNHQTLAISTECQTCHTTNPNWQPAGFPIHDQYFPLLGRHSEIATNCVQCHAGNYTSTPNTCTGCHQNDFNSSQNPNHTAAGISTECQTCHNSTAWIPSSFNHTTTGFELLGHHLSIQCSSCHQGTTTGLNQQCISCHQDDFNAAPNHSSLNYPVTCELCHNSTAWNQATFDHANTNFPLTGAHVNTLCGSCHSAGFTGTPTACVSCHQTNYNQSTNPNHSSLSLSTDCQNCHTTNPNWQPASFSIHNNYFQLIGAHLTISSQCVSCHNGNYNSTPETCIGCHQTDYNGTTNPPHSSQNLSYECLTCHNMNGWTPATFNHNFYPISNKHNNVSCNECHSQSNYQPQCMSCHLDDFNDEHNAGDPTNCWDCHSTSDWDDDNLSQKKSRRLR